MTKKAQFSPHIYSDWAELFKGLTDKQRSDVLMGITLYPNYEPENNPIWAFIKLQIDKEFQAFNERCEKNQEIANARWNKDENTNECERIRTNTKKCERMPITETGIITETRTEHKQEHYGELGYVRLTDEQYTTLKQKYSDLDAAIEVLDTWLGTTGSKHRNKNHYAYFKQNSWVWERVAENHPKESQKIEYALPKETTKEEIHKMVEARKREDEETKQRAAEAQRRSDFIKSKGYASVVSLISAGKDVYDRVMAEYRQAQGF